MSEHGSSEITAKIRSAIKAKLTELGAYVDEELPDYIMVMIANKKTKQQMTEDLNLFLAKNSTIFTDWLQNVLDRLQSISKSSTSAAVAQSVSQSSTTFNATATTAKESKSSTSSKPRLQRRSPEWRKRSPPRSPPRRQYDEKKSAIRRKRNDGRRVDRSASEGVSSDDERKSRKNVEKKENRRDEIRKEDRPDPRTVSAPVKSSPPRTTFSASSNTRGHQKKVIDDDVLVLKAEIAEEDEELSGITITQTTSKEKSVTTSSRIQIEQQQRTVSIVDNEDCGYDQASTTKSSNLVVVRKPIEAPSPDISNYGRRHVGTVRPMKRRTPSPDEGPSRKRRSTIGQVVHRPDLHAMHAGDDGLHEEYDPSRPQIGGPSIVVASTVHVTERKYTVPREMQPKSSIFLRALNEANRSVKITRRAEDEDQQQLPGRKRVKEESDNQLPSRNIIQRVVQAEGEESTSGSRKRSGADNPLGRRIQLRRSNDTQEPRSSGRDLKTTDSPVEITDGSKKREAPNTRFVVTMTGLDKRFVERIVQEDSGNTNSNKGYDDEDTLIVDVDEDELMEEVSMLPDSPKSTPHNVSSASSQGPVTQVVNPIKISLDDDDDDEDMDEKMGDAIIISSNSPSGTIESAAGSPRGMEESVLRVPSVSSSDAVTVVGSGKIMERCRYWPNCKLGPTCQYQHPTMPCKNFPQCRFGEQCLYIHPPCKFDAYCKNSRCPYTHNRNNAVPVPMGSGYGAPLPRGYSNFSQQGIVSGIPCKYGGRCLNVTCPFRHPQAPCMYGPACTKPNCAYSHRSSIPIPPQRVQSSSGGSNPKTDVAKFRWVARSTETSPPTLKVIRSVEMKHRSDAA